MPPLPRRPRPTLEVEVKGLDALHRKMEQTAEDLRGRPFINAMRQATLVVTRDARILSPVDTGRLRASITPEVRQEGKSTQGVIGSKVVYAPFMEMGTGVFAGNAPHYPPAAALETWASRHGFSSGAVVARAIYHAGGLRPRRFLQRAFEQNQDRIIAILEDAVRTIVKK